jgi:hypothetical protein
MTFQTVSVDGSGQDGAFVWWEPGKMRVKDLKDALDATGHKHLLPKASTVPAALRETLARFIAKAKIKVRGNPVDINPLREDVRGFEAVRQDRGDTENIHDFVISVVLDDSGQVRIAKHDSQYVPQADIIKDQLEQAMTGMFHELLDWYPTTMVSGCLTRVIEAMGGVLCRKAGGVYFLPEAAANRFEPLAVVADKAEGNLSVVITKFPLKAGERSYKLVLESIRQEIKEALIEVEEGLRQLGSTKQRSNGQATRFATLDALKAKVSQYEALLGVTMNDMHDAVAKVKSAVAAHNAMEMCA